MVLGGSASTLGNMKRPHIAVAAATPAVNEVQATATFEGLGKTLCGLAGAGLAGAGFAGVSAGAALAAISLAFLAPVWRRASARSRGSVIFSRGGSTRAAPAALAAGAAAGLAAAG